MPARIMWGTERDDARVVDPAALERAEDDDYTFLEAGEIGDPPAGPITETEGGPVPAERLLYLLEDDGRSRPIAVASERSTGNADVLAAVEEEWLARTGRADIRADAPAEPPPEQPAVESGSR